MPWDDGRRLLILHPASSLTLSGPFSSLSPEGICLKSTLGHVTPPF